MARIDQTTVRAGRGGGLIRRAVHGVAMIVAALVVVAAGVVWTGVLPASAASPGPGSVDTSFNPGGAGANGSVFSVAVQSDGKMLIGGGFTSYNGTSVGYLARLNADGSVDTSFNPGGVGANNTVVSVAVQPDGKILIGGGFTSYNGTSVGRLARLNANGSLDTGFNSGGAGLDGLVNSIIVQSDGKVLIGGWFARYNGTWVGYVARLNADGSLDTSFNSGGAGANEQVYSVAVQSDGKVLIGGVFTSYNGTSVGRVARLNANGSLDTSFNPGGAGANDTVYAVGVQSDGRVLIGGWVTSYNGTSVGYVARLNADGSLDTSFNSGGAGASDQVYAVAVQSDGKVLIGGVFTSYNGTSVGRVARLNANGSLDTSFNSSGAGPDNTVRSVAVQPDGKVLIGGMFTSYNGTSVGRIARLNASAVVHTVSFDANGGSGSMTAQSASSATALTANAFTRSGYTFTGWNTAANGSGTAYADGASYPFTADATLYAQWSAVSHTVSFDANGGSGSMTAQSASSATALTANAFTRSGYTFTGWNTAANGSGTAYADGASYPFTANATLYAQWSPTSTAAGMLDTSFNSGGAGANNPVVSMVVQSDGKVLLGGGFSSYNGTSVGGVARLNPDGSLDASFNSGGVGANRSVLSVAVQSDGKILIGGAFSSYNGTAVGGLARLNTDGSLDASFNSGGVGADNVVSSLAVQSDGKVLIGGGFSSFNGTSVSGVARLNADGSLDTSFNAGGAGANYTVNSVLVQSDGKILIGGAFASYNGTSVGRVARLNADGSLDASFNSGGAGANDTVYSVAVQSDGKVLIGGWFSSFNGTSAGYIARLNADGSLDTSFSLSGTGLNNGVYSVGVQSDGKVVIGGPFARYNSTSVGFVARLNADGSVDTSFNSGGAGANDTVRSVAVQSDGKVLIGGWFSSFNGTPVGRIARLNASAVVHTVSFDANGGSGSMTAQSASSATALTANAFTRSGYTFAGWNTAANGSGTAYADGASFPFTADATLYAQWSAVVHTVSFDANGGSGSMTAQSASSATALTANAFTRSGYTFAGWNTAANGSGTAYADGASFPFTEDATLYAQWSAVSSPLPSAASPQLQVALGLALGQPVAGGTVNMSATGLLPGSSWQAVVRSTPVTMASGVALSDGTFTGTGALPSGLEAGTHSVTLTATSAAGAPVSSVVWFQVSAAGTLLAVTTDSAVAAAWVLPAGSLANTGSDSADGLMLATSLLLAGGVLLVLRRRRKVDA